MDDKVILLSVENLIDGRKASVELTKDQAKYLSAFLQELKHV